jgi:hypothetical protein
MTDKSPASEISSQQRARWDEEPLPPTVTYRGGWSLTVMLCLMIGVITGNAIFYHQDLGLDLDRVLGGVVMAPHG